MTLATSLGLPLGLGEFDRRGSDNGRETSSRRCDALALASLPQSWTQGNRLMTGIEADPQPKAQRSFGVVVLTVVGALFGMLAGGALVGVTVFALMAGDGDYLGAATVAVAGGLFGACAGGVLGGIGGSVLGARLLMPDAGAPPRSF